MPEEVPHVGALVVPPMRAYDQQSGLWFDQLEHQRYLSLQNKSFEHTGIMDPRLLSNAGMTTEFETIFTSIGWSSFWQIEEFGIEMLTAEFLSSLQIFNDGISFHMFNQNHSLSWSYLNAALGFKNACLISLNHAMPSFNKRKFWSFISALKVCSILSLKKSIILLFMSYGFG